MGRSPLVQPERPDKEVCFEHPFSRQFRHIIRAEDSCDEQWKNASEIATNIAIFSLCILIGLIGAKRYLLGPVVAPPGILAPEQGTRIDLPGVDWRRADHTLVMALSTGCHFCSQSSGFYQRLLPAASASKTAVVAVFPQPTNEARAYWASHDLPLTGVDFAQAPLDHVEVSGTPTLILVDRLGVVQRSWVGKQPAQGEAEVINTLEQ
jgi:hypothetical protein